VTPRRLCREGVGGGAGGFRRVPWVPGPPRRCPQISPFSALGGLVGSLGPSLGLCGRLSGSRFALLHVWGPVCRLWADFWPKNAQNDSILVAPVCAWTTFFQQILGFPWFRRKTQKVVTLTPRGVQNDPKRHPKLPKASQRDPKVAPRASTGVHFGTLEGSLGPLLALNGSSGAVLGTLWGRLRPHRVHLGYSWRLWAPKWSEKPPF
jgi:hypothetical protein